MAALSQLAARKPGEGPLLVVATLQAALQRVPPREIIRQASYQARTGRDVDVADLERYFAVNGYVRASTVSERGEFAIRGGVIDVFAPGAEEPVRLDLFGDTLESIRAFDPETQRSTRQLKSIDLLPVSEALIDPDSIARFRKGYVAAFGNPGDDPLYASISEGARRAGLEHWLPLFYPRLESLLDYVGDGALVALDALADEAIEERSALVKDAYEARAEQAKGKGGGVYKPLKPDALYVDREEWDLELEDRAVRRFSTFKRETAPGVVDLGADVGRSFAPERAQDSVNLFEAVCEHAKALGKAGKRVLFASWSEGASERLGTMLADHGLKSVRFAKDYADAKGYGVPGAKGKPPQRVVLPVEAGFVAGDLAVISETDILGDRLSRPRKRRRASNFLAEATSLSPGDLVVHIDHGIGRYEGLKTLQVADAPHDCLDLTYAGETRLYLPVENIDLLTRYGSESEGVQLDRLGGAAWQARKARAKQRLRDMAEGLIKIAALREMNTTEEIESPAGVFDEFCARFPYEETDDQLNAIADVLGDLGAGRPMDRLICGDVGFGKTEVALRAAFVMAMSGRQVAIIGPTTLLARQHFKTFSERFAGWPVKVRQLSRMVPAKEAAETRAKLASGEIELVVGTHALLSEQVKLQGPGPGHRGRGAALRRQAQGAAEGAAGRRAHADPDRHADPAHAADGADRHPRDVDHRHPAGRPAGGAHLRHAQRPGDGARGAAAREVPRRPGLLRRAAPVRPARDREVPARAGAGDRSSVVGHGQMAATQLEEVMTAFYEGRYDVLLSTTIVEIRARHPHGQHPDRAPRRHVRLGPAVPDCAGASGAPRRAPTPI